MTVRLATVADEEALYWHLMNDLQADNGLGWAPSPTKVYEHVHGCCTGSAALAGVIDGPEGIIGSIGLQNIQPWYSQDWFLVQIWQFVLPEYRGGTQYGEELFAFAEDQRKAMSLALGRDIILETTVMSLHRLDAKARLWRRHGKQVGAMFWSGMNV